MSRDLKILSFALFSWGIGEAFFIYTQTLYMEQLGADVLTIGAILAIASLVMTLSHIPAGALTDRIGSKRIILFNWVFSLVAAGLMYVAPNLTVFTIGLVLYQFTGFVLAPLSAHITSARGRWTSARALTTTYAMFSLGGFAGSLLGWLAGSSLSLHSGYGLAMVTFVISTASVFFLNDAPVEVDRITGSFAVLRKLPAFIRLMMLAALMLFASYLSWPLTPNYLQLTHDTSTSMIRLFGALNSLGMALLSLALGHFNSRRGLYVSLLFIAISVMTLWYGQGAVSFALGYFLAGGFRAARSLLSSEVEGMVAPANKGLAFGLLETISGLALTLAPPIAGYLFKLSPALPFPVSLALIGCSFILLLQMLSPVRLETEAC